MISRFCILARFVSSMELTLYFDKKKVKLLIQLPMVGITNRNVRAYGMFT